MTGDNEQSEDKTIIILRKANKLSCTALELIRMQVMAWMQVKWVKGNGGSTFFFVLNI